jgi:hypothetical protein
MKNAEISLLLAYTTVYGYIKLRLVMRDEFLELVDSPETDLRVSRVLTDIAPAIEATSKGGKMRIPPM